MSITHLQREDTLQVFGCVGHVQPALWPRGCYCKHKGTEASVFYAGQSGFLRFRVAVHVPTLSRCPPAVHIGHCTHRAGSHSRRSYRRLQLRPCACSIFPAHRLSRWREGAHKRERRPSCCHGSEFRERQYFFSKVYGSHLERPCPFVGLVSHRLRGK